MRILIFLLDAGLLYLLFFSLYLLVFAIAGSFFYKDKLTKSSLPSTKFKLFFTCYKNDEVALVSLAKALELDYPKELVEIVCIADQFESESLVKARELGVTVVEVKFEKSTKAKAINEALKQFPEENCFYLVMDVDNVIAVDALQYIDAAIQRGATVVQGHRAAKNLDTPIAVLDALSEEMNNTIFRKGQQALGLTSAIIGSGMAVKGGVFHQTMANLTAVGGFDKELEFQFIQLKQRVVYVDSALIYDEKVQNKAVLETQRKRWLSAQWTYFLKYFPTGVKRLFLGDWQYFFKVLQLAILPRVLHLAFTGLLVLVLGIYFAITQAGLFEFKVVIGAFGGACTALLIAIPAKLYTRNTLLAFLRIPKIMLMFFLVLFKLKGANKTFIHTPHQNSTL